MGTRREFVAGMGAGALALAMPAMAQSPKTGRPPRIGYLVIQPISDPPSRERMAFLEGLRDLGYLPGKTVEIVYGSAEGEEEFLKDTCRDLLKKNVDLLVTVGGEASVAALSLSRTVPIVMLAVGDPTGIGMIKSLSRPGGNVTGLSFVSSDLAAKRMQLLKEMLPGAKRIGMLWNTRNPHAQNERKAADAGAKLLNLTLIDYPVSSDRDLDLAVDAMTRQKPDAIYVTFEGGPIAARRSDIVQFGLKHRIGVVSGWSFMTEAGGLFSYAPDIPTIFRRAAHYVQLVLKGTPPGEIPVEMPLMVEFVINLQTANAIGVRVPESMRLRANRVIE